MMDASRHMFDITDEDIGRLNDKDLRSLVGLLCGAELRAGGLSTAFVRWGGDQNSPDGGLDVVIEIPLANPVQGFIPRNRTGIQVKKSNMAAASITSEMRPKGQLRPVIADLAKNNGAYIILSGAASTTDSALKERLAAMSAALHDCADAEKLSLQFYDSSHIATWVRAHPGIATWVREKIGRPLKGWRSCYPESWVNGKRTYYVPEEHVQLHKGDHGRTLSTVSVINEIRNRLSAPGRAVRLLGLSGVGKTRLVQALFDKDVGVNSLAPAVALYTDQSNAPDPHPVELATRLQAEKRPAILIVDNCPAELHQQLVDFVSATDSTLSVITVEHDIRDGDTEAQDYFLLNPAHPSVIATLVAEHNPQLSDTNIQRICEFAGGNARIALMLATKTGHIASFDNDHLLRKIVLQKENDSNELLTVAKVCSLVYSFNGDDAGDHAHPCEIPMLARLGDMRVRTFRANLAKLQRRSIIQQRGRWRALLPQAIANRLAAQALEEISMQELLTHLANNQTPRLARSFARRLGFLDGNQTAKAIANQWLSPGGLLADPATLGTEQIDMLFSVAPLDRTRTFVLIEKATRSKDSSLLKRKHDLSLLLHFLAREAQDFEKTLTLLVKLLDGDNSNAEKNSVEDVISSLFSMAWSGTRATVSARLQVVGKLINGAYAHERQAGYLALKSMLETRYFKVIGSYFGGGSLYDAGFAPQSVEEVEQWLSTVLEFATPIALSNNDQGSAVRNVIAEQSHNLWLIEPVSAELDTLYRDIAASGYWPEGSRAVRKTLSETDERFNPKVLAQLSALDVSLSPQHLTDRVMQIIEHQSVSSGELEHMDATAKQRYFDTLKATAKELLGEPETLDTLLPTLVNDKQGGELFGAALAAQAPEPLVLWRKVLDSFAPEPSNLRFILDFIQATQETDEALADTLIDALPHYPQLNDQLPIIYGCIGMNARTMPRLHAALASTPIKAFGFFGHSTFYAQIDFIELERFIHTLHELPGGARVALKLVSQRMLTNAATEGARWAPTIRAILEVYLFPQDKGCRMPGNIGELVAIALKGAEGAVIAQRLSGAFVVHPSVRNVNVYAYGDLLEGLLQVQPATVLDRLCCTDPETTLIAQDFLHHFRSVERDVFIRAPLAALLAWCNTQSLTRCPLLASLINPLRKTPPNETFEWSELATQLLAIAPAPDEVLDELLDALDVLYVSHNRRESSEVKLKLLKQLDCARISSPARYNETINDISNALACAEDEEPFARGFE